MYLVAMRICCRRSFKEGCRMTDRDIFGLMCLALCVGSCFGFFMGIKVK